MTPETGERTSTIISRRDDEAWAQVLPMLRAGRKLVRGFKLRDYYVDGDGGISPTRIKKLREDGTIRLVGVDTYAPDDGGAA